MQVNLSIQGSCVEGFHHNAPAEENAAATPLLTHIDSVNASPVEFTRPDGFWLPVRLVEWLKQRWWPQCPATDCETPPGLSLRQEIEKQTAEQAYEHEHDLRRLRWGMGLLVLSVSAATLGGYVYFRHKGKTEN